MGNTSKKTLGRSMATERFTLEQHQNIRVGLFLGIGPIAGAHFYKLFEESFAGMTDYEHPIVLCYSNPQKPKVAPSPQSRSDEPSPSLLDGMTFFQRNGVDFVMAPCNSLMFYREELQRHSGIPILDIIGEVASAIKDQFPDTKKIGLLATEYTVRWKLYHQALGSTLTGVEVLGPEELYQREIHHAIEEIKQGRHLQEDIPKQRLILAANHLVSRGAEVVIAGCTELPCALQSEDLRGTRLIDSSRVLAQAGYRIVNEMRSRTPPPPQ